MMYRDRKLARLTRNTKLLRNWQKLVLSVLPSVSIVLAICCHFRVTIFIYPLSQLVVCNQLTFHLSFPNHCYHTGDSWVYHLLYPPVIALFFPSSSIIHIWIYHGQSFWLILVSHKLDLLLWTCFVFHFSPSLLLYILLLLLLHLQEKLMVDFNFIFHLQLCAKMQWLLFQTLDQSNW